MARQIIFYKNHFLDFYEAQKEKVREKIDYVLTYTQILIFLNVAESDWHYSVGKTSETSASLR